MAKFNINRWDSVLLGNKPNPQPMIYITADKNFREFCLQNNYKIYIQLSNTMSIYDETGVMECSVFSSGRFPNCRPNFYANTGDWVIVLPCDWLGYPKNTGEATISGTYGKYDYKALQGASEAVPTPLYYLPPVDPNKAPYYNTHECFDSHRNLNSRNSCSLNTNQLISVGVVSVLIIGLLAYNK